MLGTRTSVSSLFKQDRQNYEALSTLLGFINKIQAPVYKLTTKTDFESYKRKVLTEATLINKAHQQKQHSIPTLF